MFKKIATIAVLAASLSLGGCFVTTTGGTPTMDDGGTPIDPGVVTINPGQQDPRITAGIQQVQNTAVKVCGFLPTVQTVVNIAATFSGLGGAVAIGNQIVNAICGAVNSAPVYKNVARNTGRSMAFGTVNGVPVRGQVVR